MRRREKMNNTSMIQQEKRETVVIESDQNTITSFDETNTNTTLSTYQPGIHSSQINKQTNKQANTISLLHTHLIFDTHIHTFCNTQEQKH
jgi:hypothetical protein